MANDKAVYSIECDCFRHKYISLPKNVSSSTGAHVTLDLDQVAVSRRLSVQVGAPWGLDRIDTNGGAIDGEYDDGELTGQGVRVYVVDDGVQGSHVDFGGRVVPGYTVKAAPVVAYTRHCPCHPPTTATPRDSPSIHPTHPVPTTTDYTPSPQPSPLLAGLRAHPVRLVPSCQRLTPRRRHWVQRARHPRRIVGGLSTASRRK